MAAMNVASREAEELTERRILSERKLKIQRTMAN